MPNKYDGVSANQALNNATGSSYKEWVLSRELKDAQGDLGLMQEKENLWRTQRHEMELNLKKKDVEL